jgi:hypothetical protein
VGWTSRTLGGGMTSIWGAGPTDLFATRNNGEIYQYDGTTWTVTHRGVLSMEVVFGTGPGDVVAAGVGTDLLRYRGAAWAADLRASGRISAITRLDDGSLLGVGDAGRVYWTSGASESETTISGAGTLLEVWGTSLSNAWAGGLGGFHRKTASGWSAVTTPSSVSGLWGSGGSDVFASRYSGEVYHFDGSNWTLMTSTGVILLDVWGTGPGDVFAVGSGGVIRHYDGATWTAMASPTTQDLYQLGGTGPDDVWAVGAAGTILHYDGTVWTTQPSPTSSLLTGLWAIGPDDVFAGGGVATVLHYDGVRWSPVRFVAPGEIVDDLHAAAGRIHVVGSHGVAELVRTAPW